MSLVSHHRNTHKILKSEIFQSFKVAHRRQGKTKQISGHRKDKKQSKIIGQVFSGPTIRLDESLFIILKNHLLEEGI